MNFLVDMNLSPKWAEFLNQSGHRAIHWSAVGTPTAPDYELMNWAAARDYVVLTADLDFPAILAANARRRPSVILIRSDILTTEALGASLLATVQQAGAELTAGAIVSMDAQEPDCGCCRSKPDKMAAI